MEIIKAANLALRFTLELCALVALGYWGFSSGSGLVRFVLGIGAPLAAAVVWGVFVAPNSPTQLSDPYRLAVEALVFGSAAVALAATGHHTLGIALAAIAALNRLLMYLWGQ